MVRAPLRTGVGSYDRNGMGKLLAILDVLTEHFASEVEQDLRQGAVV